MDQPFEGERLSALRLVDEGAWLERIRIALASTRNKTHAARQLKVSQRTMARWCRDYPAITEGLDLEKGGRPKSHP